ncbi:MAG: PilZ domain-containing protein [Candidatus Omnitrophica bacterium]|nr:PilZ domain-containing protein [Candidatus Omnitrophota bacterium]
MSWDGKERRKFVRVKYPCEIIIHKPQKHIISTHAENISTKGISLIIEEKIKLSSIIDLDLYGIAEEPIVCKGKIIWVLEKKDSSIKNSIRYNTGIRFFKIKEKDVNKIKKLVVLITSSRKKK